MKLLMMKMINILSMIRENRRPRWMMRRITTRRTIADTNNDDHDNEHDDEDDEDYDYRSHPGNFSSDDEEDAPPPAASANQGTSRGSAVM